MRSPSLKTRPFTPETQLLVQRSQQFQPWFPRLRRQQPNQRRQENFQETKTAKDRQPQTSHNHPALLFDGGCKLQSCFFHREH